MEENLQIDTVDKKILSIIQGNARIPFLEVARECGLSGAAIHQRVQKLIKLGVITGSEVIVDPKKVGYHTCAYVGIYLEKAGLYKDVVEKLREIPEITQCDYTTGNYSIFVKLYTRDNEHLKTILSENLQSIQGIVRTETFICLEESFTRQIHVG
jgi:Lrp/AsnC family transcriptional regulator for asnA, asnC and gidA